MSKRGLLVLLCLLAMILAALNACGAPPVPQQKAKEAESPISFEVDESYVIGKGSQYTLSITGTPGYGISEYKTSPQEDGSYTVTVVFRKEE